MLGVLGVLGVVRCRGVTIGQAFTAEDAFFLGTVLVQNAVEAGTGRHGVVSLKKGGCIYTTPRQLISLKLRGNSAPG